MASPDYCFLYTAPCLTPEAWAAWAQAVLSAAAIWFAGRFALMQHRREIAARVYATSEILAFAAYAAKGFGEAARQAIAGTAAAHWDLSELNSIAPRMAAIPLHELPDGDLIGPVLQANEAMTKLRAFIDSAMRAANGNYGLSEMLADSISTQAGVLTSASDRAHGVLLRHRRSLYRRLASWIGSD